VFHSIIRLGQGQTLAYLSAASVLKKKFCNTDPKNVLHPTFIVDPGKYHMLCSVAQYHFEFSNNDSNHRCRKFFLFFFKIISTWELEITVRNIADLFLKASLHWRSFRSKCNAGTINAVLIQSLLQSELNKEKPLPMIRH